METSDGVRPPEEPLPLSSLWLLVPPLRMMSAVMWNVVHQRKIGHYGQVEEFVSSVNDAIPDIMPERQVRLLTLGLRAKMALQMLSSERAEDLMAVQTYLNGPSSQEQVNPEHDALRDNFVRLVQGLVVDPDGREHFLKNVLPVEFGPDFDAALETLIFDFFTRLEEMLYVPDFKQTSLWITETPSMLEEYMQCVPKTDNLRVLLRRNAHCDKMTSLDTNGLQLSEQQLFTSLSLSPSTQTTPTRDVLEVFENERESERICPLMELDMGIQEARRPSEGKRNGGEEAAAEEKSGDGTPDVYIVEEWEDQISAFGQSPSTSADNPVIWGSEISPPQQRAAHACFHCGKAFKSSYELLEHVMQHSEEQPHKCTECEKAFASSAELSTHSAQCRKAADVCSICGGTFQNVHDRLRHRRFHSAQRLLSCSHCGKNFKKLDWLRKHELTHTQNPIFKCRQCGEEHRTFYKLRHHQKTHHPHESKEFKDSG